MPKPKLTAIGKGTSGSRAGTGRDHDAPTADWSRAVAMIAAKNKRRLSIVRAERQPTEDFSESDFDLARARELAKLI